MPLLDSHSPCTNYSSEAAAVSFEQDQLHRKKLLKPDVQSSIVKPAINKGTILVRTSLFCELGHSLFKYMVLETRPEELGFWFYRKKVSLHE